MRSLGRIALVCAVLLPCATQVRPAPGNVDTDATPAPERAFVYGRFRMIKDAESGLSRVEEHVQSIAATLGLTHLDSGTEYEIPFVLDDRISILEVPPGEYRVTHWKYLMGPKEKRSSLTLGELPESFAVQPGRLHYLGDYVSYVIIASMPNLKDLGVGTTTHARFLKPMCYEGHEAAATELAREHPHFESGRMSPSCAAESTPFPRR